MAKKTVKDVDWSGKRALVRVDFNVPFERGTKRISDDIRIREALPTINYIRDNGGSVVLCTHLGRPGGKPDPELELGPIADRLADLLQARIDYVHDAPGDDAKSKASALKPGDVLLLENIRFWPGEDPVGRSARLGDTEHTIVGVVRNAKVRSSALEAMGTLNDKRAKAMVLEGLRDRNKSVRATAAQLRTPSKEPTTSSTSSGSQHRT